MTSPRFAESQLQGGKARVSSESRAQDTPTKVRLIQQILPACRHPDSSRAYLVSGHVRMSSTYRYRRSRQTGWYPQVALVWTNIQIEHWPRGVELIKPRVNYSLGKF